LGNFIHRSSRSGMNSLLTRCCFYVLVMTVCQQIISARSQSFYYPSHYERWIWLWWYSRPGEYLLNSLLCITSKCICLHWMTWQYDQTAMLWYAQEMYSFNALSNQSSMVLLAYYWFLPRKQIKDTCLQNTGNAEDICADDDLQRCLQ
jgi:hypothetical protein